MATAKITVPISVYNLWHGAQISHTGMPTPAALLRILQSPRAAMDDHVALALQEASIQEVARLTTDGVLSVAEIHSILVQQIDAGRVRRRDLLEWSQMFL